MSLTLRRPRAASPTNGQSKAKPAAPGRARALRADGTPKMRAWWRTLRVARVVYTAVTLTSAATLLVGVAMVYLPAALVLGGFMGGALGLVGLGLQVRGAR